VINREISVGNISMLGVTAGSVMIVGDTQSISCASVLDTPPEAVAIAPIQPFPSPAPGAR
jgi:spore germination protein PD